MQFSIDKCKPNTALDMFQGIDFTALPRFLSKHSLLDWIFFLPHPATKANNFPSSTTSPNNLVQKYDFFSKCKTNKLNARYNQDIRWSRKLCSNTTIENYIILYNTTPWSNETDNQWRVCVTLKYTKLVNMMTFKNQ